MTKSEMQKKYEAARQEAIRKAEAHNERVDRYREVDLVKHFGKDTINGEEWFEAMQLIRQQKFYESAKAILPELKRYGVSAAINMQSETIVFYDK